MDKVKCMPFIILCMLLSGCGAEKNTISTDTPTETAIQTSEIELKTETKDSSKNATETTAEKSYPKKKTVSILQTNGTTVKDYPSP